MADQQKNFAKSKIFAKRCCFPCTRLVGGVNGVNCTDMPGKIQDCFEYTLIIEQY